MPIESVTDISDGRLHEPVRYLTRDSEEKGPQAGLALCLSGGGYRAMLFHLGSIWRLFETGYLTRLERISSVSGGSIAAGVLGLAWPKLFEIPALGPDRFNEDVVKPIRGLAGETIDATAVITGILLPGSISEKVIVDTL